MTEVGIKGNDHQIPVRRISRELGVAGDLKIRAPDFVNTMAASHEKASDTLAVRATLDHVVIENELQTVRLMRYSWHKCRGLARGESA